jgi:hypothetical protein
MRRDVEFKSEGEVVRGHLYTPDDVDGPYPILVMAGGWCYVKEMIQPSYAEVFVKNGFACLIFDYRRLGASEGTPRQHLDPWDQIEDYKNAITFARTLDDVDPDRLGIWGISYSGGHVLIIGATDPRVRCIVSNIPVVDGWDNMRRVHGTMGFRKFQEAVMKDRESRGLTGEYGYMDMAGDATENLVTWPFPETREIFLDLKEKQGPAHEHFNTIASAELLMNYNVFPYVGRILSTPTMMIVADNDDLTLWDREIEAFNGIASTRKKLFVIPETTHMTLYSDKSRLEIAADAAAEWFQQYLGAGAAVGPEPVLAEQTA